MLCFVYIVKLCGTSIMNVNRGDLNSSQVKKKVFNLKPVRKDGLILQIHHTIQDKCKSKRIRFLYSAFDSSGLVLANADIDGNIFVVDFSCNKFWSLPKFNSCSVISFSNLDSNELIVGLTDGKLLIINIHLGAVCGYLIGHTYPVKKISFSNNHCLTSSHYSAIIFDLKTRNKIHELTLESETALKQVYFMPVTNNIIACFSDDYIHVWKHKTFESFKQIFPSEWNKISLKSIAFTRDGTTMILAGISPVLIVFSLDTWTLSKILNLPQGINSIKSIDFISQPHDAGANKFLILLASDGIVYILDMDKNVVVSKIQKDNEIISFSCSTNGIHLACILHSGEVNLYKVSYYIESESRTFENETNAEINRGKLKLYLPTVKQTKESLDLNKLQGILKQFGEYPESYRALIWSKILVLPNNSKCYSAIINKGYGPHFKDIDKKYPLINKSVLKNLKKLLSNLGSWCPIFYYVEFLPLFVFPFVKIFENDPVQCFEAVITIILNWCQLWFEYTPCAPINVLAMIENVFIEHDSQLVAHLTTCGVTSHLYAWSLLEVAFSEVFTIKEWCILWDHILSNEPSFVLMLVVAYNIVFRSVLITLSTPEEFEIFYHSQNPISLKKIISKTNYLLNNTSDLYHPRQYLKDFEKLPTGSYPLFDNYPKIALDFENNNMQNVEETEQRLSMLEQEVSKYKITEEEKQKDLLIKEEKTKRLQQLEDLYHDKMLKEKERIEKRRIQLSRLRTSLHEKQAESLEQSRKKIEEINLNERKRELNQMLINIDLSHAQADYDIQKTEEDLSKHYVELLQQKEMLENLLLEPKPSISNHFKYLDQHQQRLNMEMDEIQQSVNNDRFTNKVKVPMRISVVNNKMQELDMAVAKEMAAKQQQMTQCHGNVKIIKMEKDTKQLEQDVQRLLNQFTNSKIREAKRVISELSTSALQSYNLQNQIDNNYETETEYYGSC